MIKSIILSHASHMSQSGLSAHMTANNPAVTQWLATLHLTLSSPQAVMLLASEVSRRAQMIVFNDIFWVVMMSFVTMVPLLLLIKSKFIHEMLILEGASIGYSRSQFPTSPQARSA